MLLWRYNTEMVVSRSFLAPVLLSGWIELLSPISPDPEQAALWLEGLSLAIRPVQTVVLLALLLLLLIVIPVVTTRTADGIGRVVIGWLCGVALGATVIFSSVTAKRGEVTLLIALHVGVLSVVGIATLLYRWRRLLRERTNR